MNTIIILSFLGVFLGNLLWRRQRFQISQGVFPSNSSYSVKIFIFGILAVAGIAGLIFSLGLWKGILAAFIAGLVSSFIQK